MKPDSLFRLSGRCVALWLVLLLTTGSVWADVRLPRIFSSHMVLQRDQNLTVWGWAAPRERITLSINGQLVRVRATPQGTWRAHLAPMPAGGPYTLTVSGKNTIVLEDILIGEVWICSGQSNMEWRMANTNNAEAEITAANYPNMRLFTVRKRIAFTPEADLDAGQWEACTPASVPDFSAVAYFFGRKLQQELDVPIGLIHTSWGGTNIETWISGPAIVQQKGFEQSIEGLSPAAMEAMKAEQKARFEALLASFGESKGGLVDGKALWADPALDESNWKSMKVPGLWEQRGLEGFDGVVWFRKTIELTAAQAAAGGELQLGPIDDQDITWVNGQKVGTTDAYNESRIYPLAPGVLKAGKNIIAIRVLDSGGGGGLYGKSEEMQLVSGAGRIPLAGDWKYRVSPQGMELNFAMGPNDKPTLLFNGMIHPLIPFAIQGAIWYQGESNAGRAYQYRELFPALIRDWRGYWGRDLPFLYVQLANYMAAKDQPDESAWAELREAQTMTLSEPKTGMAVTIDIGEANDIHPRNKQDVGLRLALAGLKVAYSKDIVYSGPQYRSMEGKGQEIVLSLDHVGGGLVAKDKYGYLRGFAIAGADRQFHWAQARIEGNQIIVHSPQVAAPVSVRYAWAENPDDANLYNAEDLPAVPFRTDEWEGVTFGKQ